MNRPTKPYEQVKAMLGDASPAWEKLVGNIRYHYEIDEFWAEGNPTHKHYNNLLFKRGGKSLITLCLREGHFLAVVVLGAKEREKFEQQREKFSQAMCDKYDACDVLHDGLWLGFEIRDDALIDDILRLLPLKRRPNRKVFPESVEVCGKLDIGMTGEEITRRLTG